jgi:hypothetical protein
LDARQTAELSLREATERLADALCRLVSQNVSSERAAASLELDAKVVRHMTKLVVGIAGPPTQAHPDPRQRTPTPAMAPCNASTEFRPAR